MDVQKISNNAVQQIIDTLTLRLLEGEIGPGDQIPTEVELAERFGVARNTVREAIKIQKGSGKPNVDKVGSITKAQLQEIAEKKMDQLNAIDIEGAIKIIAGTARSMGVTVEE